MSKKKKRPVAPAQSGPVPVKVSSEQEVYARRGLLIKKGCALLCTAVPQAIAPDINKMLAEPKPEVARMLDAWRQCGRRDAYSPQQVDVARAARQVQTAFGFACLFAYAQAYEDEVTAHLEELVRSEPAGSTLAPAVPLAGPPTEQRYQQGTEGLSSARRD